MLVKIHRCIQIGTDLVGENRESHGSYEVELDVPRLRYIKDSFNCRLAVKFYSYIFLTETAEKPNEKDNAKEAGTSESNDKNKNGILPSPDQKSNKKR